MRGLHYTALILAIVGAINWGLVGLFGINLVTALFGWAPALVAIIYILVGLAGVTLIFTAPALHGRTPHSPPTTTAYHR